MQDLFLAENVVMWLNVHTVMWQNECVARTMDKANGNVAVFYTINGDSLGKIVANCTLCKAFCKIHCGEGWQMRHFGA